MNVPLEIFGVARNKGYPQNLLEINECLSLALQSSHQLAFDWLIPEDELYFHSVLTDCFKDISLDTTKIWKPGDLFDLMHEDDKANFCEYLQYLHLALKDDRHTDDSGHRVEFRLKGASCEWRWMDIRGKIVEHDPEGRALRMTGIFSDIDESKLAEEKVARLRKIHTILSHANPAIIESNSQAALFQEICHIAVEHGRFQMAWISLIDQTTGQLKPAAFHGGSAHLVTEPVILSADASPGINGAISAAMRKNRIIICNTRCNARSSSITRQVAAHAPCHSIVCIPLRQSSHTIGVVGFCTEEKNYFDNSHIPLLEELMMDISLALSHHEREAQRAAKEKALIRSEQFKNAILTAALDCIISLNQEGEIIHVNQAAELTFGYRSTDIAGKKFADIIIPPEWRSQYRQGIAQFLAAGESAILNRRIELNAMHADGSLFPVELAIVPIDVDESRIFTAFIRDITARKREEEIQAGQNHILNMVATGAGLSEILNEIALFIEAQSCRASCAIRLLDPDGTNLSIIAAPGMPDRYRHAIDSLPVASHGSCSAAALCAKPVIVADIASNPLWANSRETALLHDFRACASWPIIGKNRTPLGTIALYFRETTTPAANELRLFSICANLAGIAIDSRASEERIRYLAHYDGLTSLPNRFLFQEFLDLALRNAQRHLKKFAIFFLDLDKFKEVNDTYGHETGDQVLKEIAARFRSCVRQSDKIARMGGDEFYVLIEDLKDGRHAAEVAQKFLEEAARPVRIGGNTCQLSASIGISVYPDDGLSVQALLKNADDAMYCVKHSGRNAYQFHSACRQKSD